MKKHKKQLISITIIIVIVMMISTMALLGGCQAAAKQLGGDYTLDLPAGEKLVNITWKDDSLWYLTKPMTSEDIAETYKFQQSSNFGVLEGTVTVVEHK